MLRFVLIVLSLYCLAIVYLIAFGGAFEMTCACGQCRECRGNWLLGVINYARMLECAIIELRDLAVAAKAPRRRKHGPLPKDPLYERLMQIAAIAEQRQLAREMAEELAPVPASLA